MSERLNITPIGRVLSCYPDKFGTPRQPGLVRNATAFLEVFPEFQPEISLEGLQEFSHLWVLFYFHKNSNYRFHAKIHPPRLEGRTVGLFASRSPHRPNPIGLSLVRVEKVQKDGVWVSGIDIIDGTPIVDLKPYLPSIESRSDAVEGWVHRTERREMEIVWLPEALDLLRKLSRRHDWEYMKVLIDDTLSLDPRPLAYKGYEGQETHLRDTHAVRFHDVDVHFRFLKPTLIQVETVRPN